MCMFVEYVYKPNAASRDLYLQIKAANNAEFPPLSDSGC